MNQGGILEPIPITQDDKAFLGVKRNKALKKWTKLAVFATIVAVITIIIGIIELLLADFGMDYFGGPVIIGVMTLVIVFFSLCAVREGRKYPTGDQTGGCFKGLVFFYLITSLMCLIGSGVILLFMLIGLIGCFSSREDSYNVNPCHLPDGDTLKPISIIAAISCLVLTVANVMGCVVYSCNTRAFGFKSRNEIMLEYQTQMLTEVQRSQAQQFIPQQASPGYPISIPPNALQYQGYPSTQGQYGQYQGQIPAPVAGHQGYLSPPGPHPQYPQGHQAEPLMRVNGEN